MSKVRQLTGTALEGGDRNIRCHSFVRSGRIEFLSDSTHALAGQTVDLPDDMPDGAS